MRRPAVFAFVCLIATASLAQQQEEDTPNVLTTIKRDQAPKEVLAAIKCDAVDDFVTREPFARGYLWESKCPSNHANEIKAQVYSRDKNGKDAKLIRFPSPDRKLLDEISNPDVYPANQEFNALFTDPEDKNVCRTEARWIAKDPLKPKLVFWRETKDCEGTKGWKLRVKTAG